MSNTYRRANRSDTPKTKPHKNNKKQKQNLDKFKGQSIHDLMYEDDIYDDELYNEE
jgi:hypothetical protein